MKHELANALAERYNPPEKSDNFAKAEKAVPLQAWSSRLWDDTVDLMPPLRQKWQSPHSSKRVVKLVSD